ncbi:hypothetical protein BSKO_12369 [Bryopsis sp. KO-2023]|nr:hypothetical protein BSKO_12369 [Bryopsis sp. KO-2023]
MANGRALLPQQFAARPSPLRGIGGRRVCRVTNSIAVEKQKTAAPASEGWLPQKNGNDVVVRFGFPKGSLQKSTEDLFGRAGFKMKVSERNYFPQLDDDQYRLVLFRSQEISRYVEDGVLDAGICGKDWIIENNADVVEVCELRYSKATSNPARWVLAVRDDSPVQSIEDLEGAIVASELVETTRKFFEEKNINVKKVEYSWGATEVKAMLPGIGAIVDITETGSSLRANNLRIVDTIMSSTTRLVANKESWEDPELRRKIEDLGMLLQGAILGRRKVGLKLNAPREKLDEITSLLPATLSPTVAPLVDSRFFAVDVIIDEQLARDVVTECRRLGASGIVTYSLKSIIPDSSVL